MQQTAVLDIKLENPEYANYAEPEDNSSVAAEDFAGYNTPKQLEKAIATLNKQMLKASKDLDFIPQNDKTSV